MRNTARRSESSERPRRSATTRRPASASKPADEPRMETLPCGVPIPTGVKPDDPIPPGLDFDEQIAFRIARMDAAFEEALQSKAATIALLHKMGLMTKKGRWKKIYR